MEHKTYNPLDVSSILKRLRRLMWGFIPYTLALVGGMGWDTSSLAHPEKIGTSKVQRNQSQRFDQIQALIESGEYQLALSQLKSLTQVYAGQPQVVNRLRLHQAQVLSLMGYSLQAFEIICGAEKFGSSLDCATPSVMAQSRVYWDDETEATALGVLGTLLWLQGNYSVANQTFSQALSLRHTEQNPALKQKILFKLSRIHRNLADRQYRYSFWARQQEQPIYANQLFQKAQRFDQDSLKYLRQGQAIPISKGSSLDEVEGEILSLIPLTRLKLHSSPQPASIQSLVDRLNQLPLNRRNLFARIHLVNEILYQDYLGQNLMALNRFSALTTCHRTKLDVVQNLGRETLSLAQQVNDRLATAYAYGLLGHLAECARDNEAAISFTEKALQFSPPTQSYIFEWQLGRIYRQVQKPELAQAAYERAIFQLNQIRSDVAIANRDFQLDVRDSVSDLYRQLAKLQLTESQSSLPSSTLVSLPQGPSNFLPALQTLNELKISEIRNYLGSDCDFPINLLAAEELEENTAHLSTIVLEDRIGVITTIGGQAPQTKLHWIPVNKEDFDQSINNFRRNLERRSDLTQRYRQDARQFYNWLIAPLSSLFKDHEIETLVFSQDGLLNSIPMGALMNGERYLIEDYAISSTPSLQVISPQRNMGNGPPKVLAFGLTEPSKVNDKNFASLPAVNDELNTVAELFPRSGIYKDQQFTTKILVDELQKNTPDILHLATHTRFGFDAENTYLVTGGKEDVAFRSLPPMAMRVAIASSVESVKTMQIAQTETQLASNQPLGINELYQIIRENTNSDNPIDLLLLTGCETAAGSEREALGIAGIALQAGVKSTMATLWQVEDQASSELVSSFYKFLKRGETKAKALQLAQLEWLQNNPRGKFSHAGYWASFVLIGDWQ